MRTLVDIPEAQLRELTEISRRRRVSRAALIRQAVESFLAHETKPEDDLMDLFGAWGPGEDGVEMQRRLRDEWSERS